GVAAADDDDVKFLGVEHHGLPEMGPARGARTNLLF
ncbi:MAG: hypothetical protein RLZZ592_2093, partial [Pseudomonadota bacterium]